MKANNFKKAVSYFALASVFTMASCQKDELLEEPAPQVDAQVTAATNVIQGQYIVVLKNTNESTSATINDLAADHQINKSDVTDQFDGRMKGFTGRFSKAQLAELRTNPDVATIEPDQIISLGKPVKESSTTTSTTTTTTTSTTPTSTSSTTLTLAAGETVPWGVSMVGYGDGTGKTAWVIDSGIDTDHPDLKIDLARSISFITGVTSVEDGFGHGTMVAGVIGAKNNGSGIIGVAANATIVAVRVLNDTGGGTLSALIKAVNHVGTYGKAGDVMNISISASASSTLDNAVKTAASKGIFVAIAAGNSRVDCSNNSPQRVNATNVFTVSNHDANKNFASSSNFGAPVDRAAPGVSIYTTAKGGGYANANGTSFSAPHVAGALLMVGNALTTNGQVIGDPDSWKDYVAKM